MFCLVNDVVLAYVALAETADFACAVLALHRLSAVEVPGKIPATNNVAERRVPE
jgi:hypothetical protein